MTGPGSSLLPHYDNIGAPPVFTSEFLRNLDALLPAQVTCVGLR